MEYTKLEYIESTGTQYIDIGFKLNSNHTVDMDLQLTTINSNIFGSRAGAMNSAFTLFADGSSILTDIGGTRNSTTATTDRINVYLSSSKIKIGIFEKNISSGSFTTPSNGYIFNISYSKPQSYMASMKLYSCKIYNNDTLIRDFIPVKRDSDKTICLYDLVSQAFFTNLGSGTFIAGPIIAEEKIKLLNINGYLQPKINGKKVYLFNGIQTHYNMLDPFNYEFEQLEYIKATGTQYIDTGVKFKTGFACDIKFNMLSTSGDIDILSSAQNDNYLLVSYLNGTPRIYLNSSDSSKNVTMPYNTVHTVNMNYNGTTLTYKVDDTTTYTVSKSNATANSNLLLFARSSSYGFSNAILYYCKIYEDENLVRDFIPAKQKKTNKIGLYDKVSKTFFGNSGTGEFLYQEKKEINYIELTGTQYINTTIAYLSGATQYGFYLDFEPTEVNFTGNSIYSVSSGNSATESSINADGLLYYKYGGNQRNVSTLTKNTRYIYEVDHRDRTLKITLNGESKSYDQILANFGEPLYLGYRNGGGYGKFKIYNFKIYKSDVLVQDLIPVKVIEGDNTTFCFYDKVTGTYFNNSGTGEFIGG